MSDRLPLFEQPIRAVNVGIATFAETLAAQGQAYTRVDWRPPAGGDERMIRLLARLDKPGTDQQPPNARIDIANQEAFSRIDRGDPVLIDIRKAGEVLPGLGRHVLGHAGPPLAWDQMTGPLQGAIIGAIRYEKWAADEDQARQMAAGGKIRFVPNHDLGAVGPMTGMISESMPLLTVRNEAFGNIAYCTFNEGLGKVMRFGANDDSVIDRLRWLEQVLAPAFRTMLERGGPISLKVIINKALAMGDEMHQRNIAASSLFFRDAAPRLTESSTDVGTLESILAFLAGNDQFFLNLAMAAGKSIMDPARGIEYSSLVTAMSRNGTNFGIRVSGLGDRWFEAPVEMPVGLYFPGYSAKDANPDIGDSTIVETFGIGGFAMAAAPAVVRFVGAESVATALDYSRAMSRITFGHSSQYLIPNLEFDGVPSGIDVRKVVMTGIQPVINTGMAHREAGIGQVGAGIVKAPLACFTAALEALAERYGGSDHG